MNVLLV